MQLSSRTRTPRSWCWRDAHFHSSRARRPLLRVCVLLSAHFNAAHQHRTDKTMHTFITLISAMKAQHAAAAQRRIISYDN